MALILVLLTALTLFQSTGESPTRFASRNLAQQAGCQFVPVKGAAADSCVLATKKVDPMRVVVYDRTADGSYVVANDLTIPNQYWTAKLSFESPAGAGRDWLVVETTGVHGTAIAQRVLLVFAWDGARFKTIAAESLQYRCSRPTAAANYELQVAHSFATTASATMLQLRYELTRDKQALGNWSDSLRWDQAAVRLVPIRATGDASPEITSIRESIARVRAYSATRPFDPGGGSREWFGESGLMSVLDPACVR